MPTPVSQPQDHALAERRKARGAAERQGRPSRSLVERLARNALWMVPAAVALVLAVEGLFAVAHVGEQEFIKIDPHLGFLHLENKLVTFRSEGFSCSRINKAGFRDEDYPLAKPPGVVRVAVLGDSKTEAFQVPIEETFVKVLERKLSAAYGRRFQVMNFGVSGYSTGQEYLLYLQRVAAYHPDVVVLAYHIGDSDENVCPDGALASMPRPYFTLDGEGRLAVDGSLVDAWLAGDRARVYRACDGLRRHSRIWGVLASLEMTLAGDKTFRRVSAALSKVAAPLWSRLARLLPDASCDRLSAVRGSPESILPPSMRANMAPPPASVAASPDGAQAGGGSPPGAAAWQNSLPANEAQVYFMSGLGRWQVTAEIIRALNAACTGNGARLVVAALPAPDNSLMYFKELRFLRDLAAAEQFQYVNLHDAFPSLSPMEKSPLYIDFHFSRQGHALVADRLYNQLTGPGGALVPFIR